MYRKVLILVNGSGVRTDCIEQRKITVETLFERFVSKQSLLSPFIGPDGGGNGIQVVYRVKALLGYHENDEWALSYPACSTSNNSTFITKEDE